MDSILQKSKKKIRNEENSSEYHYSSDSSEYASDSCKVNISSTRSLRSSTRASRRLPTRRPDPNVFNRNALMARENRRKKKEYIEMLEKDIEKQRKMNKKLHKIVKQQAEYVKNLQNERNYFKSILANKTQIISLVNLLRTATIAQQPSVQQQQENSENSDSSHQESTNESSSPFSSPLETINAFTTPKHENNYNNGTVNNNNNNLDRFLSPVLDNLDFSFTDYNLPSLNTCNSWDDLFHGSDAHSFDTLFDTEIAPHSNHHPHQGKSECNLISDEHSYYSTTPKHEEEDESSDSGVCLHISGGKLSLEFCVTCHENAKKPVIEEF